MLRILQFLSGSYSETEVSKQLYDFPSIADYPPGVQAGSAGKTTGFWGIALNMQ
jgi:hypothetical protein